MRGSEQTRMNNILSSLGLAGSILAKQTGMQQQIPGQFDYLLGRANMLAGLMGNPLSAEEQAAYNQGRREAQERRRAYEALSPIQRIFVDEPPR